jgi:hypothetical protein
MIIKEGAADEKRYDEIEADSGHAASKPAQEPQQAASC